MANERKGNGRPPLDFARVADAALKAIENVLAHWVPSGKREGREWVAINPTRSDQRAGSFSVNTVTGAWSDFATGDKGGDLVALVAYIEHTRQPEACERLARFLGIDPAKSTATPVHAPEARQRAPKGDYRAVMPVPAPVLAQLPQSHPRHGAPSQAWDYRGGDGGLLFRVCRFDGIGERGKVYAPLSYGEHEGRTRWHWKAVPAPRPLYGLDRLAAQPDAVVVLVEGEKAADAATALFPAAVVMTWPGGAKAINEADFSPLRGREVWYWPDNDAPGTESIPKLAAALQTAQAARCSLIALALFARYRPTTDANGAALMQGGTWPDKSDAADAVAMGWTAAHIAQLQQRGELLSPVAVAAPPARSMPAKNTAAPASDETENAPRFTVNRSGVYWFDSGSGNSRRLCAWLEIVARSRSRDGRNWGVLVRFRDHDDTEKLWNIPMALFGGDTSADVIRGLFDRGLEISTDRNMRRKLLEYLQGVAIDSRVVLVEKMGWHDGGAFMLPDRVLGTPAEPLHYYSDAPAVCRLHQAGTLDEWKANVARVCEGNPLLCFAVSAAFASPLLDVLGSESAGFHFVGESSLGKSTLSKVAASVCGHPEHYPRKWRATDNALEAIANAHSDLLLILDEIGQCDARIIGETIYMLGNGEGKARATDRGGARDIQHRWRIVFLSNGEKTLGEHMAEANKKPQAGMEMRFLTVTACLHDTGEDRQKLGIFQEIGGYSTGAELAEHLLRQCAQYHGTALPAYLEMLCEPARLLKVGEWLLRERQEFAVRNLSATAGGQAKRAADKFALVGAAGELATKWGITGWPKGEAMRAAERCFQAWVTLRGGEGNLEEKQILEQIRHHFETFGESRYTRWESSDARTDEHAARTMERYGFRSTEEIRDPLKGDSTESVFYVYVEAFRQNVCKGIDHKRAARLLAKLGALKSEKDRHTGKARLPGAGTAPVSCYIVKYSALCSADDDDLAAEPVAA